MKIIPYTSVGELTFGASQEEAVALFGLPRMRSRTQNGEYEFSYPNFIIRFDASSGLFREFTFLPGSIGTLAGMEILWNLKFLEQLGSLDTNLKEAYGYIISIQYGVALTGFHDEDYSQMGIHVFRRGDYDVVRESMVPYKVSKDG